MKRTVTAFALIAASTLALATGKGNDNGSSAEASAHAGASAHAQSTGSARIDSDIHNLVANTSVNTQTAVTGGNKLTNEGNNSAQRTNVTIGGDVTESNTPPVVAGVLPSVPTSCRLYLFGGGSTRDGAGSGTFPIGNDQTCLSIAMLNLMERAGGFTQAEKQVVVCKVEGMAALPTCKSVASK